AFPLIGRVKAGGKTLRIVEADLKARLRDEGFFKNPQVTVAIDQYKSQKIFIVGEVRAPGTYQLSGEMSLIEALARAGSIMPLAGGLSERGATSRIRIVRIVDGNKKEYRVKLGDPVQPGDTIIVPERFF